jgi:hypothetical protein
MDQKRMATLVGFVCGICSTSAPWTDAEMEAVHPAMDHATPEQKAAVRKVARWMHRFATALDKAAT